VGTADLVGNDSPAQDQVLLERISSGDADALGDLYDRFGRPLFGMLYAMLPSPEAAEEVVQDVFHSVWREARSYRAERGSVRGWLLRIGRNAAIDWRRTKGRRIEREVSLDEAASRSDPSADDAFERVMRSDRVRAALATLPPEQREVLVLSFYRGLTQAEIAARTGAPLGTVKGRARLAMARLRDELAGEAVS
jgi:RNA polymerase sigma-70 factor (ECF subfamily)